MSIKFNAGVFSEQTEKICKDLVELYEKFDKKENAEKLCFDYDNLINEKKITVAFVGQYSSGKSTIIKALTGDENIEIKSDIATDKVTPYEWGRGCLLFDTPGLKTGEKEDHDKMTMEAIGRSDLLVYCITSDLFSPITKNDFEQLAKKYPSKLFLLINKMSAESGDYDELVENYTNTIKKTLSSEYSIIESRHFFIDAKDYLTGVAEKKPDYIDDSHFENFIHKLNEFTESNGIIGKFLTPVSKLIDSVDETLCEVEPDEYVKENISIDKQICDVIENKKRAFIKAASDDLKRKADLYIGKGEEVAQHLGDQNYEFSNDDFQEYSEPIQTELCTNIQKYFAQYADEVDEEIDGVIHSEMAQHFFEEYRRRLEKEYKAGNNTERMEKIEDHFSQAQRVALPKINNWIGKLANVTDGKKISIWTVSGSDLHKIVKKVGGKIGHKFKPFEALKITERIAKLGKHLGKVIVGIEVLMELCRWCSKKIDEKELNELKEEIRDLFKDVAEAISNDFEDQIYSAAKEFDNIKDEIQKEIDKLEEETSSNIDFSKQLLIVKKELTDLQKQIETCENKSCESAE